MRYAGNRTAHCGGPATKGQCMAKFEVYSHEKVVETFDAERVISKNDEYVFKDRNAETVGSIVKAPGMSVKKVI